MAKKTKTTTKKSAPSTGRSAPTKKTAQKRPARKATAAKKSTSLSNDEYATQRQAVRDALAKLNELDIVTASTGLFATLGYTSDKLIPLSPNTAKGFIRTFAEGENFNADKALTGDWKSVDFIFQLTDDEVRKAATRQIMLFESKGEWNHQIIESYLFAAIELEKKSYTRTELSSITRAINRLFPMPVMLLFRHGDTISISIIKRRLHRKDSGKDVLEKVTLIKDISIVDTLRAHIEILLDLSLPRLHDEFHFHNFVGLHDAWSKRLDSYDLNKQFYREIANWYFWATSHKQVVLPRTVEEETGKEKEKQYSIFFIRLLTRLIFCWFLQEKRWIPRDLFRQRVIEDLLNDSSLDACTYYPAILQNLFFATLNQETDKRDWRKKSKTYGDPDRGISNRWRYKSLLEKPKELTSQLRDKIPFVNGGLFDCLDNQYTKPMVFLDGFSERKDNGLFLPNDLFFGPEREVDLSKQVGDTKFKKAKVRGIIHILSRYKFTVEENTPLEQEIALDPELLGKVFENLLASYNDDTQTTARKALGAFYTPREIVSYMVDQSLRSYLETSLGSDDLKLAEKLDALFQTDVSQFHAAEYFTPAQIRDIIAAIGNVKIIDPACGSGAFPMGALHRLVDLLQKLDPNNETWKRGWLDVARQNLELIRKTKSTQEQIQDAEERIADVERSFDTDHHALDFARKLHLIENCIYGVDIQPIACQIAKLRFFIALIVDQFPDPTAVNMGVRPLPNLETKIVAADALIPIEKPKDQMVLFEDEIRPLRRKLEKVRHDHFNARTPKTKAKHREKDAELRKEIASILKKRGDMSKEAADDLAHWDPYDQNHAAPFFDPEWMFGISIGRVKSESGSPSTLRGNFAFVNSIAGQMELLEPATVESGFDIVLANPPYVRQEKIKDLKTKLKPHFPNTYTGTADLYVYFYDRALQLLKEGGSLAFISSNKWFRAAYGEKLRTYLAANSSILHLIDFGDAPVFDAIAYPTIVIAKRMKPAKSHAISTLNWDTSLPKSAIDKFDDIYRSQSVGMPQAGLGRTSWQFIQMSHRSLIERIQSNNPTIGDIANGTLYRGIVTGYNEAFVINNETRNELVEADPSSAEILKPFLRGRDIKKWRVEPADLWIIFSRRGIKIDNYPAIKRALAKNKQRLTPKPPDWPANEKWIGRKAGSYEWFEIQDNIAYWNEFQKPKVVFPDIASSARFAFDSSGHFIDCTLSMIPTNKPWLTDILNSSVVDWYFRQISPAIRGGYLRFKPVYVLQIPIPHTNSGQQGCVNSVSEMIRWSLGQRDTDRDMLMLGYFEQLLNGLVYELYFPDELHAAGLRIFDLVSAVNLQKVDKLPESKRLVSLRQFFERIYDLDHPIRSALFSLQSMKTVRIIEGKE